MSDTNSHRARFEGWRNDNNGTVERFDKECYRWVRLNIDEIPPSVIDERREN